MRIVGSEQTDKFMYVDMEIWMSEKGKRCNYVKFIYLKICGFMLVKMSIVAINSIWVDVKNKKEGKVINLWALKCVVFINYGFVFVLMKELK